MRVEDVHPREPVGLSRLEPREHVRHDRVGRPLGQHELRRLGDVVQPVVVEIESGAEAELAVERIARDECCRREPLLLQQRGRRHRAGRDAEAAVVADAVLERVLARQDAHVRRQREHRVRVGELEAHAPACEAVEVRRIGGAAVGMQRVGPQRVDGDEQDVLIQGSGGTRPASGGRTTTSPRRRPPPARRGRRLVSSAWPAAQARARASPASTAGRASCGP